MLRFAPSPTGDMTINDLRVALFNYIVSQQKNEDFIVRIEDTEKEKNIEGKDNEILDTLALFGIEYSQVIHQSQNVRFHSAMALQLMHEKQAFSCFCSSDWLEKKRQEAQEAKKDYSYDDACRNLPAELVIDNTNPFTIRIKRPDNPLVIKDVIQGNTSFEPDKVDSFVIMNQDKTPTPNFASAVDDMLNDISLVIRTKEQMSDTPKQEHIRNSLDYAKKIEYAHLPAILNNSGDIPSVKSLLAEGYLPEAITNYLMVIANEPSQELFNMKDTIEWFKLENISKDPVYFDIGTLKEINKRHLQAMDAKELSRYVGFADAEIGELARIYLEEVQTTKELKTKIAPIFAPRNIPEKFKEQTEHVASIIKASPYFDQYNDFKNYLIKESALEEQDLVIPLRLLLTNAENGPDIAEVYKHLKNYLGEIVK